MDCFLCPMNYTLCTHCTYGETRLGGSLSKTWPNSKGTARAEEGCLTSAWGTLLPLSFSTLLLETSGVALQTHEARSKRECEPSQASFPRGKSETMGKGERGGVLEALCPHCQTRAGL